MAKCTTEGVIDSLVQDGLVKKNKIGDMTIKMINDLVELGEIYKKETLDTLDIKTSSVNAYKVNSSSMVDRKAKGIEHINHTGGAYGADSIWADMLRKFGITNNHYRPNGNKPTVKSRASQLKNNGDNVINITKEEATEGNKLNRSLGNATHDMNNRNLVQVYNAETILAVAPIVDGKVDGGTGSAVRMAESLGKEVYVLDTTTEEWHVKDDGIYTKIDFIPQFTSNFAAIGTRRIEEYSVKDKQSGKWVRTKTLANKNRIIAKMKEAVDNSFKGQKEIVPKDTKANDNKITVRYNKAKKEIMELSINNRIGRNIIEAKTPEEAMNIFKQIAELTNNNFDEKRSKKIIKFMNKSGFKPFKIKLENRTEQHRDGNGFATAVMNDNGIMQIFHNQINNKPKNKKFNIESLLFHEYIHHITTNKKYNSKILEKNKDALDLYTFVKKNMSKEDKAKYKYALSNVNELFAVALEKKDLAKILNEIEYENTTVFKKLIKLFTKIFKLDVNTGSVLAEILGIIEDINSNTETQDTGSGINTGIKVEYLNANEEFTRNSVQNNEDKAYIFTDNLERTSGGKQILKTSAYTKEFVKDKRTVKYPGRTQAVIRGLNNAFPITTMRDGKGDRVKSQWKKNELAEFSKVIDQEIAYIKKNLNGRTLVVSKGPNNKIGQGGTISVLPDNLQKYLDEKLLEIGIDNSATKLSSYPGNEVVNQTTKQENATIQDIKLSKDTKDLISEFNKIKEC